MHWAVPCKVGAWPSGRVDPFLFLGTFSVAAHRDQNWLQAIIERSLSCQAPCGNNYQLLLYNCRSPNQADERRKAERKPMEFPSCSTILESRSGFSYVKLKQQNQRNSASSYSKENFDKFIRSRFNYSFGSRVRRVRSPLLYTLKSIILNIDVDYSTVRDERPLRV